MDSDDCNDSDSSIHPNATEICDGIDNNCNTQIDENIPTQTWYLDEDEDGYGVTVETLMTCQTPPGYAPNPGDCKDSDADIYPGAEEVCDGIDQDCNDEPDNDLPTTYYQDLDNDGYGNSDEFAEACSKPLEYVSTPGDCNDDDNTIHFGATEICNSVDDDCDGAVDEDFPTGIWYLDSDGDTFGGSASSYFGCQRPPFIAIGGDCNDEDATIHPGTVELCDGIDNNCDGIIDESSCWDKSKWDVGMWGP